MSKEPNIDLHELTQDEVCNHMRPFIQATMVEHEQTRKEVKDLKQLVVTMQSSRVHNMIQDVVIVFLFIGMMIALTAC